MASSHRKKTVGERKTAKALLQETERLREENAVLRIQASTSGPPRRQRSKGQVANSRPEPESIYPGSTGAVPGNTTQGPMSHAHPCLELPVRKAQIPLISQQKDSVIENHSCQVLCAQD
ncbi:hypothetical protein CK203_103122 [Vitis vinifera]|uniref:Uncharacterized protein n=1 Tax=Vitis vinifera TaxID=29760 RepID=A0A438DP64_VITVI|nr:hypothetical protein CK203_103122 [Vitis vinifera]